MDDDPLTLSAYQDSNDAVFARLMRLHVPERGRVADVTFGKGSFWKLVPDGAYEVLASDLQTGIDCRALPYEDDSLDCVVFDPPYMDGFFRPEPSQIAHTKSDFRERYLGTQPPAKGEGPFYHEGVLDLYYRGGAEAWRVLRPKAVLVVKCQDEVSNHRQHLTHVQVINHYEALGFYCKDLFVVVRRDTPHRKRIKNQAHARKNHSYFLVFVKPKADAVTLFLFRNEQEDCYLSAASAADAWKVWEDEFGESPEDPALLRSVREWRRVPDKLPLAFPDLDNVTVTLRAREWAALGRGFVWMESSS
jgi:hypothetical protein